MRKILIELEFDTKYWYDYDDVSDELMLEDADMNKLSSGVYYKIVPKLNPEFLQKIDWALLREQKASLLNLSENIDDVVLLEKLEGIIILIDAIQDYAIDEMCLSEKEVFNLTEEDK